LRSEEKIKRVFERQISELEMKALRAQMNPHFIFNSLNSIQKFIFEKDEYAASQYLTKFSRLIRLILDQSNQEFVTIGSEIELLRHYIEMEQLRFKNRFSYTLDRDQNVQEEWLIPSMVVQPHVENAIWHGLMHKQSDCMLQVRIEKLSDAFIRFTVEDNGVGREKAGELRSKQVLKNKSYGSKISQDRIQHFNRLHGIDSIIKIVDLKDELGQAIGTKVIFDLSITKNSNTQKIGH
jgi:LytS/YehU family sensor histidine kinase